MSIGHRSKRRGHWVIGYLAAFKFRLETSIGQRPVSNRAGKSGSQTLVNTFSAGEGSPQTKHSRRKLPVSSSPLFSSNLQLLVLDLSLDYLDCCDEWCQSLVIGKVVGMSTPVRNEFQSAGELGDETRFKRLIPNLALARPTLIATSRHVHHAVALGGRFLGRSTATTNASARQVFVMMTTNQSMYTNLSARPRGQG